ncbi:MAG: hypothetical protein DMF91_05990 [Acidobacteria bacterium]|nr:MAG: hypothetical protein DMF91_05990 [Acidobacteriota bacterium]
MRATVRSSRRKRACLPIIRRHAGALRCTGGSSIPGARSSGGCGCAPPSGAPPALTEHKACKSLPFPDATFDVVVSRAAIHNLSAAEDRAKAIGQIACVLKPGGQALIDDIRHHGEYVAAFAEHQCPDVRWFGSPAVRFALTLITMESLRPATLLVRKAR